MKHYLLILSFLVVNYSLIIAQGTIIKNGDFEQQGDWKVVQTSTTNPVTVEFGSTTHTVNGGQGGNMVISYTVPSEQQVFVYQPLDLEADKEYSFSLAFDNESDDNTCWWASIFYCLVEPTDGNDIDETQIIQIDPWHDDDKFFEFNGLLDTTLTEQGVRIIDTEHNDYTKFKVDATDTYYVGINFGGCSAGEIFTLVFDELKIIDPDIVGVSTVTGTNNELSFYPNPASNNIEVSYKLQQSCDVDLTIFNSLGQKITTLNEGTQSAGIHSQSFDCSNLENGLYYGVLKSDNNTIVKKIVISK